MNKYLIMSLLALGMLAGPLYSSAQNPFQGIAHYVSSMSTSSLNVAGRDMNPEMQEALRKQLAKQMQRDFSLKFNTMESLWQEKKSLDPVTAPSTGPGGMQVRISAGNSISYINPSENLYLEETEIFGKKFLINDELPTYSWKISNEEKKIGQYTVKKATYIDITEQMSLTLDDSESKSETVTDTTTVTAWFATDIPVSHGPNNTYGLPGLILELNQGDFTFLCTKVELNPDTQVIITRPAKGKMVTSEEAETIREEKMQEMMKKMDTGEGGTRRIIRIGG